MIKAEPKTILNFLSNYFEVLKDIFDVQKESGQIRKEKLNEIFKDRDENVLQQLLDYKILKKLGDDFEFRDTYFKLFEFILNEFRPLLPETIQKYERSIGVLFKKIRDGINGDKLILGQRILDLHGEIKEFSEAVEKNTIRLLAETRELKSNVDKLDYMEKVRKASFWIDYYITPLNNILDINHAESITNKLFEISNYVNIRRLNFDDELIRLQFEKLYVFLVQSNDDLLRQSKLLTNELLPLIERIRTESVILTGFIEFLKAPHKAKVPKVFKVERQYPYSNDMYLNAREFVQQFLQDETIFLEDPNALSDKWVFNKDLYKEKLMQQLPLDSFFDWAGLTLRGEYQTIETDKLFALTALLFEDGISIEVDLKQERSLIRTSQMNLRVPKIKINRYGIS
ncbi:MAG: hypothetical protein LCH37_10890 [Bacteroidetes bacterium]|nr:hypothetical protein [Bacteroidota bacterium]MCK6611796.1 hypothetical protein [Bacteroidia bacterium]